jgi:hypothetical protein
MWDPDTNYRIAVIKLALCILSKGGKKTDMNPKFIKLVEDGKFDDLRYLHNTENREHLRIDGYFNHSNDDEQVLNSNDFNNSNGQVSNNNNGQAGGKPKHTYKARKYIIRTGSRGGKYILVKNQKIYV